MYDNMFKKEYEQFLNSNYVPSEECLEKALIYYLVNNLGFVYREDIKTSNQLKSNFKNHFEKLNNSNIPNEQFDKWWIDFNSGDIFNRFLTLKSKWFQLKDNNDNVIKTFNYFDFDNINNNKFEIINQLWTTNANGSSSRFDVILLINGIPIIHIELKNETVDAIDEAAKQINRYLDIEAISDFLRFTKLYVVSNGTKTRYFVNNNSIASDIKNIPLLWTDIKNNPVDGDKGILKFADSFFNKEFLLDFINNYFVVDNEKKNIKVFRPYQYYAANEIIKRVTDNKLSNKQKSGYVWHATGSGKTLTSFKTCEILSQKCKDVDLTIFLIDRNDLNTQTFNNFKSFSSDPNLVQNATNTNNLVDLLIDKKSNKKIIITTIQKLNNALKSENKNRLKDIANKKVVFMVDECHRSQIGEMRKNIDNFFKNSINIAFTGTPIFDINSNEGRTTESIFGEMIHKYTSYNAIKDENVLEFIFKFTDSIKKDSSITERKYQDELDDELDGINNIKVNNGRIQGIINYIYDKYDNLTRNKTFNAMLACSSIQEAIAYYDIIKTDNRLSCAIVFSVNNSDNSKNSEISKRAYDFIIERIKEYNSAWVDYNNDNEKSNRQDIFNKYKTHIQKDFSDRKYDLIIVVSMLLTGYDSPITNTLFLDKQLRYQSLIQAISRTNRLYNGKESGNIISFKTSKEEVEEAFKLYTNGGINTPSLWKVLTYSDIKPEFEKVVNDLLSEYPSIDDVVKINTKDADECIKFLTLFKKVMKLFNKIKPLIDFNWNDFNISERTFKQYKEHYKSLLLKANDTKLIYVWDDYEIIDLDTIRVDVSYLKKLFNQIIKFSPNQIPEQIEDFEYYKKIINTINEQTDECENTEYLREFLRNKEIYICGDFSKIVNLWKKYIDAKISNASNVAEINWKTNSKIINKLMQELKIKKELDKEYIRSQLPEYINDPLFDDEKFNNVDVTIRKLLRLKELKEISLF